MEEKEGKPNCEHKWEYDPIMIGTYPVTYHRICVKCGRLEHEYGMMLENHFNDTYEKFWGKV